MAHTGGRSIVHFVIQCQFMLPPSCARPWDKYSFATPRGILKTMISIKPNVLQVFETC